VTLALLSVAAYGGALAWACLLSPRIAPVLLFLGGWGLLLLLLVLVRGLDDLLGTAILFVGVCYVVGLIVGRHPLDEGAPLVAGALLLCAELATWSLEERFPVRVDRRLRLARAGAIGVLVGGGLLASGLVLAVSATSLGGGLAWAVLGTASAVLAVGVAARFALTR
jgi:hypothetical protein